MFKLYFGDRDGFVCEGDTITCELEGFTFIARVYRDDNNGPPDKMQDGFWPSLDPKDAGYIGPKTKRQLATAKRHASHVMAEWKAGNWWYCGIAVTAERAGVQLTEQYSNALWGVDCNYPKRGRKNKYLRDVANELLGECLQEANAKLDELIGERA